MATTGCTQRKKCGYQKAYWRAQEAKDLEDTVASASMLGIQTLTKLARSIVAIYRSVGGPLLWLQDGTKKLRAKLVKWSLGFIPGKPRPCKGCTSGTLTSKEHLLRCSNSDIIIKRDIERRRRPYPMITDPTFTNILDEIISCPKCAACPETQVTLSDWLIKY